VGTRSVSHRCTTREIAVTPQPPSPPSAERPEPKGRERLERRVIEAAEAALAARKYVTAIDVLVGLGWLRPPHVEQWRQGRIDYLERVTQADLRKVWRAMSVSRRWALDRGLKPSETAYVSRLRGRPPLRFSKSGDAGLERAYRTHWISPDLSDPSARALRSARAARPIWSSSLRSRTGHAAHAAAPVSS
jgi:hypothetical protein